MRNMVSHFRLKGPQLQVWFIYLSRPRRINQPPTQRKLSILHLVVFGMNANMQLCLLTEEFPPVPLPFHLLATDLSVQVPISGDR